MYVNGATIYVSGRVLCTTSTVEGGSKYAQAALSLEFWHRLTLCLQVHTVVVVGAEEYLVSNFGSGSRFISSRFCRMRLLIVG